MKQFKRLGQVFLSNYRILEDEAKIATVKSKVILEIGPGDGRLTEKLLGFEPKKIIAIEKDIRFAELLKDKFAAAPVEVILADFLELEMPEVDIIIGNIPYYISSSIIFKIKDAKFDYAILMVQKEFGEKMLAKPNESNYGRLSVTSQIFFSIEYLRTIPKSFFSPKPKVDSALIKLVPTGAKLNSFQEEIIRKLFQHRNKTVRNALKGYKIQDNRRVRTLTKEDCLKIADKIHDCDMDL